MFRLGTDTIGARDGWTIDDVKVQSCVLLEDDILFENNFEEIIN